MTQEQDGPLDTVVDSRGPDVENEAILADPRAIGMDDAKAEPLINTATPIYYITGTIHSPEAGSPTALMELASRLAVDGITAVARLSHL